MLYNYWFEIASMLILFLVLHDYRCKMRVSRPDGILFQLVILSTLAGSMADLISSLLIEHAAAVPLRLNILAAALYFMFQSGMIFALACFSFLYMNPRFGPHSPAFWGLACLFAANFLLSAASPWTGWYFRFDAALRYVQGPLCGWGYYFYYINVLACLLYALYHRRRILKKDLYVAGWVAVFVCCGVTYQYLARSTLVIDFSVTMAVLYLYMTLENPNDYQDKLTHCTNNYGFKLLINMKTASSRPFTVLFLDIKKFRYVNAIYGMEMGNSLLQQAALFLESSFPREVVFRVNDDVFALVFPGRQENITWAADKIRQRFTESWSLPDGRKAMLEAVQVICEYPRHFSGHTELLELRSYMMAAVKGAHSDNVLYADSGMTEHYRRREAVEQALRKALQQNSLEVYYQPIFDSDTQSIPTAEALSRLMDTKLGMVPPDEFIAVAERTGLIIPLGFYVLEQVCTFIETQLLPDPCNTIRCIHVNISMLQCAYPGSNAAYLEILRRHHVPPEMIQFELTESSMLSSPDIVRQTMNELIAAGIHFALDDYGTGFSNISYLVQFPFDKIKFDKQMVWSYFDNATARTIMTKEFDVFHAIKKDIVVEGIETQQQYEALRRQGIHLFQGYFFSRPVPGDQCRTVMHKWSHSRDAAEQKG